MFMKNVHVLIKVLVQLKNIESPDYNPDTFYKLQSALKKSLIKNDSGQLKNAYINFYNAFQASLSKIFWHRLQRNINNQIICLIKQYEH